MNRNPIAILDSGIGGLSILEVLAKKMPQESFLYFPDEANFPYGSKDASFISSCIQHQVDKLQNQPYKAIVLACHTASIHSLYSLQSKVNKPVFGIAQAAATILLSKKDAPFFLASKATINSYFYQSLFPFAHFIEAQDVINAIETFHREKSRENEKTLLCAIEKTLAKIPPNSSLFLGCTHFIMSKEFLEKLKYSLLKVIDPSSILANQVYTVLEDLKLLNTSSSIKSTTFLSSNNFYLNATHRLPSSMRKNLYENLALPV